MKTIQTKKELIDFMRENNLRDDWHEPDESEVTAEVYGKKFDNAGFWGVNEHLRGEIKEKNMEMWVLLRVDGDPAAEVNLATLFSLATDLDNNFL